MFDEQKSMEIAVTVQFDCNAFSYFLCDISFDLNNVWNDRSSASWVSFELGFVSTMFALCPDGHLRQAAEHKDHH